MDILFKSSGVLTILGTVIALGVLFYLPRLKSNKKLLTGIASTMGVVMLILVSFDIFNSSTNSVSNNDIETYKIFIKDESGNEKEISLSPEVDANTQDDNEITVIENIKQFQSTHSNPFSPTTRPHTLVIPAKEGYRIVNTVLNTKSEARVTNLSINQDQNGKNVILNFNLTSGPQFDRYRGWIEADLELTQVKNN